MRSMPPSRRPSGAAAASLLVASLLAAVVAAGAASGCKPSKPDPVEQRRAQAAERAAKVKAEVASKPAALAALQKTGLKPEVAALEVARVGDHVITLGDVAARIAAEPPHMRARYATAERRAALLDRMIEFEILAAEAQRAGLDKSPDVQMAWKAALAKKLLDERTAQAVRMSDITEDDLRVAFAARKGDLSTPERRRAAYILLATPAQALDVRKLLDEAIAKAPNLAPKIFGDFVKRYSKDKKTAAVKGDLGWFDPDGNPEGRRVRPPLPAARTAFALQEVNDVSQPIHVAGGMALVQLTGKRPGHTKTFEEAREELRNKLFQERQEAARRALIDGLKAKAKIELHEDVLAKLPKALTAGARPKGTPKPPPHIKLFRRPNPTHPEQIQRAPRPGPKRGPHAKPEEVQEKMRRAPPSHSGGEGSKSPAPKPGAAPQGGTK